MPPIDLTDPETKAAVDAAVADATAGLKAKNNELLGANRKLKDQVGAQQGQLDELNARIDAIDADKANKGGDVEAKIAAAKKPLEQQIAKLQQDNATLGGRFKRSVTERSVTEALTKAGVATPLLDAALALIERGHKIEVVDGEGEQTVVQIDGKPAADFVGEWAKGDQGKHFKAAGGSAGGGARGAGAGAKGDGEKTITRADFDALPAHEQSAKAKDHRIVD